MKLIQLFILFTFKLYFTDTVRLKIGAGVCKSISGTLQCCTNYQQKSDGCVPCEVGTYGVNCFGGHCPYGFYGFSCQRKCNCTTDQYCDRRIGCVSNTIEEEAEKSESDGNDQIAEKMLFIALGVFLGVGSILTILFMHKREKHGV